MPLTGSLQGMTEMLAAHLALAFLVKILLRDLDLFYLLVGTSLSGFDAILPIVGLRDEDYHCGSIFHSIWPPVMGAVVLLLLGPIASISFLTGGIVHLLGDSTDVRGRPWLYPLSRKRFGVAIFPHNFRDYVSNPVCLAIEICSVIFLVWYALVFGIDLTSWLWIGLLIPLFIVFAVHRWRTERLGC